jgi:sugar phosphate isomerase/epimerase
MQGGKWRGSPDDILDAVAAAGYQGVEFSNVMIGDYRDRPGDFRQALAQRGLELAAFAYARAGFTDPATYEEDLAGADQALRFAAEFSVPLALAGPSSPSRDDYEQKFAQACRFATEVALCGKKLGVTVAAHPHSHHTSLVMTGAEYDRFLAATEDSGLMFNPDTGHIVRGGQDLLACFQSHRERIVHVHCKDVDTQGNWMPMGQGVCDFPRLFQWLEETGYRGWLISEEESNLVWSDLPGIIASNREYFRSLGC